MTKSVVKANKATMKIYPTIQHKHTMRSQRILWLSIFISGNDKTTAIVPFLVARYCVAILASLLLLNLFKLLEFGRTEGFRHFWDGGRVVYV